MSQVPYSEQAMPAHLCLEQRKKEREQGRGTSDWDPHVVSDQLSRSGSFPSQRRGDLFCLSHLQLLATMQFREPCLQCEAERVRLDSAQDADSAAEMWDQQSTAADHCHLTPSRCQSQAQILALSTAGQDVWHAEPGKGKSTARVSGNGVEQTARHSTGKNGAACTGLHWEGDVPRAWQKGNGKHRPGGLVAGVAVSMRRKAMGDAGAYC